jgi:hypothetical protein
VRATRWPEQGGKRSQVDDSFIRKSAIRYQVPCQLLPRALEELSGQVMLLGNQPGRGSKVQPT